MQDVARAHPGLKVLLVGSGGREHALAWKLAQSPLLSKFWAAPGNPGIAAHATCVDIAGEDVAGIVKLADDLQTDLVVVGPDDPLAAGLVDALQREGRLAFGPTQAAARIESSKSFTRALAERLGVPGPRAGTFDDAEAALAFVRSLATFPVVVKADGLFRGKGVVIAETLAAAEQAVRAMLVKGDYGDAGRTVVIEEFLRGEERSYIALCDGEHCLLMQPSQDHKRAYDGDRGPNTGGMGVVAPAWRAGDPSLAEIEGTFFKPVLAALCEMGTPFRGALYAGAMLTAEGPKLIEFNARFGDPEAEALLPLLRSDLLPLLMACAHGNLGDASLEWHDGACVTVVMASHGYPEAYPKGLPMAGLIEAAQVPGALVFHAGTASRSGVLVTNGGRVLCVAGIAPTLAEADHTAYEAVGHIRWDGSWHRTDIGGVKP